jgi:hypothetical protein
MYPIRISVGRQVILTEVFHGIPEYLQVYARTVSYLHISSAELVTIPINTGKSHYYTNCFANVGGCVSRYIYQLIFLAVVTT